MMKRNYVTPMIAVEHYDLTQSIAACQRKIGWRDTDCVLKDKDSTDMMRELCSMKVYIAGCDNDIRDWGTEFDGACYHTSSNAAFTSG
jgi:hypothetical protein